MPSFSCSLGQVLLHRPSQGLIILLLGALYSFLPEGLVFFGSPQALQPFRLGGHLLVIGFFSASLGLLYAQRRCPGGALSAHWGVYLEETGGPEEWALDWGEGLNLEGPRGRAGRLRVRETVRGRHRSLDAEEEFCKADPANLKPDSPLALAATKSCFLAAKCQ